MNNQFGDFLSQRERSRDLDEMLRRTIWGELRYESGSGGYIQVRGTDYNDEDVPVLNLGYGFNLGTNANAEVITLAMNSDTNQKMALLTLPRDQQRQWPAGTGGFQHPGNPNMFIQFDDDGAVLDVAGTTITVAADGAVTIQTAGNVVIAGDNVDIQSNTLTHNGTNIGETHIHPQGNDSDGNNEQDTGPPQ